MINWILLLLKYYCLNASEGYALGLENEENNESTPQELQKKYPEYDQLISDLLNSQNQILDLLAKLDVFFFTGNSWKAIEVLKYKKLAITQHIIASKYTPPI